MLLIAHEIRPSEIHGLGVFSTLAVPKGTCIWTFNPLIDRMVPGSTLHTLPDHSRMWVMERGEYLEDDDLSLLCADGDLFMNHADDPSMISQGLRGFAARHLAPGDEITCNYRDSIVVGFQPDAAPATLPVQTKDRI